MSFRRIGILGGTFDPPHLAHLEIAQSVLASGLVDQVLMVPCFRHAFSKKPVPFEHRLAMCRRLTEHVDFVAVSDIEREMAHPGRSLELVEALSQKYVGASFRLVVGADIFLQREKWYRFDLIEEKAPPIYFGRRGVLEKKEWLAAPMDVSSETIRQRLRKGMSVADMVSQSVLEYIVEHQLYGA
ncbi:MAG: nicotinate-nicotinamide nucleotide adenylyltransferase [Deltaproteobacteria bacterium]|nr:nicotinate-nicotinamide nucleotide adenylyltransferase [Deltaproteobacteria bacterium]